MLKTWQAETPEKLEKVATDILALSSQKIILFCGSMGAGKTSLIKAICRQLGVNENTSSPTFALIHEYAGREKIYHFDLFRINKLQELTDLGFTEYLDSGNYVFIEWPEIADQLFAGFDCAKVHISIETNLKRSITLEA